MPTDAPARDALWSALEKALPCHGMSENDTWPCRDYRPGSWWCSCCKHLERVYAAVAPLLDEEHEKYEEALFKLHAERAAREAAERDTARLDWLGTMQTEWAYPVHSDGRWYIYHEDSIHDVVADSLREAIDAARSAVARGDEG